MWERMAQVFESSNAHLESILHLVANTFLRMDQETRHELHMRL